MVRPNGTYTQQGQVKFSTPILQGPGQVSFPINVPSLIFIPDTVIVNNQTAATVQVGPSQGGPYQTIRQYSYQPISWQYAPSLYVQQLGSAVIASNDFFEVDVRSSPFGAPSASSYVPVFSAPAGWGPVGPGAVLADLHSGDQFHFGQVQQIINLLTGRMSGQLVQIQNEIDAVPPSGDAVIQARATGGVARARLQFTAVGVRSWDWEVGVADGKAVFADLTGAVQIVSVDPTTHVWSFLQAIAGTAATFSGALHGATATVDGRITASAVGADAKTLLNYVPITPTLTTVNNPANNSNLSVNLSGVSASAVAVAVAALYQSGAANGTDNVQIQDVSNNLVAAGQAAAPNSEPNASGIVPSSGATIHYLVSSTGTRVSPLISFWAAGYYEPT